MHNYIMRQYLIYFTFILSFLVACDASVSLGPSGSSGNGPRDNQGNTNPSVKVNDYEKEIFKLVNDYRASKGRVVLKWHDLAIVEAQDHSQDMAAFKVPFGHIGYSLRIQRIKDKDPDPIKKDGENVAKNSTAKKAFNAWLLSSGHHKNILGDYTHTGIGAVKSANGSWYFTQIFLKK